jgi:hypothetical protein
VKKRTALTIVHDSDSEDDDVADDEDDDDEEDDDEPEKELREFITSDSDGDEDDDDDGSSRGTAETSEEVLDTDDEDETTSDDEDTEEFLKKPVPPRVRSGRVSKAPERFVETIYADDIRNVLLGDDFIPEEKRIQKMEAKLEKLERGSDEWKKLKMQVDDAKEKHEEEIFYAIADEDLSDVDEKEFARLRDEDSDEDYELSRRRKHKKSRKLRTVKERTTVIDVDATSDEEE